MVIASFEAAWHGLNLICQSSRFRIAQGLVNVQIKHHPAKKGRSSPTHICFGDVLKIRQIIKTLKIPGILGHVPTPLA